MNISILTKNIISGTASYIQQCLSWKRGMIHMQVHCYMTKEQFSITSNNLSSVWETWLKRNSTVCQRVTLTKLSCSEARRRRLSRSSSKSFIFIWYPSLIALSRYVSNISVSCTKPKRRDSKFTLQESYTVRCASLNLTPQVDRESAHCFWD